MKKKINIYYIIGGIIIAGYIIFIVIFKVACKNTSEITYYWSQIISSIILLITLGLSLIQYFTNKAKEEDNLNIQKENLKLQQEVFLMQNDIQKLEKAQKTLDIIKSFNDNIAKNWLIIKYIIKYTKLNNLLIKEQKYIKHFKPEELENIYGEKIIENLKKEVTTPEFYKVAADASINFKQEVIEDIGSFLQLESKYYEPLNIFYYTKINDLLNDLDVFAGYFKLNIAAPEVLSYKSIEQFMDIFYTLYPYIANRHNREKTYENIIWLYDNLYENYVSTYRKTFI